MADTPKPGTRRATSALARGAKHKWMKPFLARLGATSNVSAAARHAGVSNALVYETRRIDPAFARAWRAALCEGYDNLEMDLLHRLRSGEVKPAAGAKRGARAFDNATALRLLAAHRETVAREKAARDDCDAEAILASIDAKLERMRQRSLAARNGAAQPEEGSNDDQ